MYRYDEYDHALVRQRIEEFRGQVARRLRGDLTEEEFKPLRLMNGVYLQLHAYMLRVAIPYGTLSADQLRRLAHIARRYDRGFGHFTTRQNIQYNWPRLVDIPDILDELADVEMHAIQTSGNCIRNVTTDHFAGAAADEVADPRPYAELVRQWSTLHPEFSFLPRKFKIALSGAAHDRTAAHWHDIGLIVKRDPAAGIGFEVIVGGGMGRTPVIGPTIRDFLPEADLLSYLEAILRVYNAEGRRDNIYKARIKILVDAMGAEAFADAVEAEWRSIRTGALALERTDVAHFEEFFSDPAFEEEAAATGGFEADFGKDAAFANWVRVNTHAHKAPGYTSVTISLKPVGGVPGDASAEQMERVAELADGFAFGEIRVSHEQNLILPHVPKRALYEIWQVLSASGLATANAGLVSDIIACPGLDYCALANARSIPIAQRISERFADIRRQHEIGPLKIKISGCINSCGHHHAGHIGILGVDRKGEEFYQLMLGGSGDEKASAAEILGPGFSADDIVDAIETVVETYVSRRREDEPFIETYRRIGADPFKEAVYANR